MLRNVIESLNDPKMATVNSWLLAGGTLTIFRGKSCLPEDFQNDGYIKKKKKGTGFNVEDDRHIIFAITNIPFPNCHDNDITGLINIAPLKNGKIDDSSTGLFIREHAADVWMYTNSKINEDVAIYKYETVKDFIALVNKRL